MNKDQLVGILGQLTVDIKNDNETYNQPSQVFQIGTEFVVSIIELAPVNHDGFPNDDYDYTVTRGPRKTWDGEPFLEDEGWEPLTWARYDVFEERTWKRLKKTAVN